MLSALLSILAFAQKFDMFTTEMIQGGKKLEFRNILCASRGSVLITSSVGLLEIDGTNMKLDYTGGYLTDSLGNRNGCRQ